MPICAATTHDGGQQPVNGRRHLPSPATAGNEAGFAAAGETGFALIEMLVAMLLLSLVGLTLARFQTFQLAGTASLTAISAARLEADNIAIGIMAAPHAPTGSHSGISRNAGHDWHWRTATGPTIDDRLLPDMVRIDIRVSGGPGQPVLAERQVIRPLIWQVRAPPPAQPGAVS